MRRVLFVCSGNLCRSPFAEYLLQKAAAERGLKNIFAESAGTMALEGNPAASKAVAEAKLWELDLRHHRARLLTRNMIEDAELVAVMEKHHYYSALALAPGESEKIILLGELLPDRESPEIEDPYGQGDEYFISVFTDIARAVEKLLERLEEYR
ncbi:MAG: low molecular weight phosphotyrosine protein phosphatase [Nitrospinae bacterium]|nr:low molecular weight phosphotyrosine protein phosphatase [Nitrospinota bacterium]